ncbi:MAG: hypothetical protein IJ311_03305 [Elusimicrobiaceae bacterium]|nr:hypothetical protein [Elusimicrobiaceae bacterium]
MGVAVAAMGIKLSAVAEENTGLVSAATQRMRAAFLLLLGGMLSALRTIFLPYLAVSLCIWLVAVFAVYQEFIGLLPVPLSWFLLFLIVSLYGTLAFGYAVLLSLVFGVKVAAGQVEDFLYELFASLKEQVRSKINDMDEGLPKQQAKVILENSVTEVLAPLRNFRLQSAPKAAGLVLISALTFVTRSVFLARLARLTTSTVQFSSIFASRATLVGALFLNLRWLAVLVLWLLYGVGFLALILNIWILF